MGALVMTPLGKAQIDACVAHARQPEHWYRPGPNAKVPGHDSRHVVLLGPPGVGYRVVFSWTVGPTIAQVVRHLSISNLGRNRAPHPTVVFSIATLFGFTGGVKPRDDDYITVAPGPDWLLGLAEGEAAVIVGQPLSPEEATP